MKLPKTIADQCIQQAEQAALGGNLSEWGDLTFYQVMMYLGNKTVGLTQEERDDFEQTIIFWEPFEHYTNQDMFEQIETDYLIRLKENMAVAEFTLITERARCKKN